MLFVELFDEQVKGFQLNQRIMSRQLFQFVYRLDEFKLKYESHVLFLALNDPLLKSF